MKRQLGQLRIIGGEWRSRLVSFDAAPKIGLRATPDRVRQPLFDWLAPFVQGAVCLDLFAGSGALGLEALSRGAAHCTFVDKGTQQAADIRAALTLLKGSERATVMNADALTLLRNLNNAFPTPDVVFLDPPFASPLLAQALPLLLPLLKSPSRVYLEWQGTRPEVPAGYVWLKEKQAGAVSYGLLTHTA